MAHFALPKLPSWVEPISQMTKMLIGLLCSCFLILEQSYPCRTQSRVGVPDPGMLWKVPLIRVIFHVNRGMLDIMKKRGNRLADLLSRVVMDSHAGNVIVIRVI